MRSLSPKYVAVLALIAAGILVVGWFLRPMKGRHATPPPDTTATPLERISREAEMRETADFLSQRTRQVAKYLVYLPDLHASGIAWDASPTVMTTDNVELDSAKSVPCLSLLAAKDPNDRHLQPAPVGPTLRQGTEWAALVAKGPDGELLWAPGLAGGNMPANCGEMAYHEIAFNAPVTGPFAGGGLFNLNGELMGVAVRCGDKFSLVAASDIASLLKMADSPDEKLWRRYGVRFAMLTDETRAYFGAVQGLLVTEVQKEGLADLAGLLPGDIVVGLNDQPVTEVASLTGLLTAVSTADFSLKIQRSGKQTLMKLPQPGASATAPVQAMASLGLEGEPPPRGVALSSVLAHSPAQKAGLRPGDRVWQVGLTPVNSREALNRALTAADQDPIFVLFDRGPVEHGALLASGAKPK